MVGASHNLPSVTVIVDVTPPGQCLKADAQSALGGPFGQLTQVVCRAVDAAELSGDTLEQTIRRSQSSSCIRSNLRSARGKTGRAARRHAFEIAERLERNGLQAQAFDDAPHIRGRSIKRQQVVFENLDALETGGGDSFELLVQRRRSGRRSRSQSASMKTSGNSP